MQVEYSVLLNNFDSDGQIFNGVVEIDSDKGHFGDKDYNKKVTEAIYAKHPGCKIIEFGERDEFIYE